MKVLAIPSWFPTEESPVDGIFICEQLKALQDSGQCTVAALYHKRTGFGFPKDYPVNLDESPGFPVFRSSGAALPKLNSSLIDGWTKYYHSLYDQYEEKLGKPDLIHAHSYIGGFAARRLVEKHQIPLILTEHSSNFLLDNIYFWHKKEISLLFKTCSEVIAVSDVLREKMKQFYDGDIHVVPNLVDTDVFKPTPGRVSREFTVLVVSSLDPNKMVGLAIEAFAEFRKSFDSGASLIILGDGPLFEPLAEVVHVLGISNQVKFIERLNPAGVAKLMRNSSVLLNLSSIETFGKVNIEAIASGIPVIASFAADPANIINSEVGVQVDSEVKLIASAISTVAMNYRSYDPIQMKQYITDRFGKDQVVKQILEVYEKALTV